MRRQRTVNPAKDRSQLKLGDVIATVKGRGLPLVSEESTIRELIDVMVRYKHTRLLYVVDKDRKLLGTIALGLLVRHVFCQRHEPNVHPRHIMSMITTEMAKDIMQKKPISAAEDEDVDVVLKRMIQKNVKEIAVLDDQERVVADITMIDLLTFFMTLS